MMFEFRLKPLQNNFLISLLVILLLLVGCGANGLLIRYFYGEFDDKLYERITNYATFTEEQKKLIKQAVDGYKSWHKENEMPRYATFLDQMAIQLNNGEITDQIILDYFDQVRKFTKTGFEHSPVYKHPEFFKTLTDQQIEEITNHFVEQDKEFLQWFQEQQEKDDHEERLKRIVKNTKRVVDVNLSENQQQILRGKLAELKSNPLRRHEIYNKWQAEFVEILRQRDESDFTESLINHLGTYQDQIKLDNPQQYETNQMVAAQLVREITISLDKKQKQALLNRLRQTKETLISITNS